MRVQKTTASMIQAYESLMVTPRTVADVVQKLLASMQLDADSKNLISWLAAAERPLTFSEIKLLQQVNVEKGIVVEKHVNVENLVQTVKPLSAPLGTGGQIPTYSRSGFASSRF